MLSYRPLLPAENVGQRLPGFMLFFKVRNMKIIIQNFSWKLFFNCTDQKKSFYGLDLTNELLTILKQGHELRIALCSSAISHLFSSLLSMFSPSSSSFSFSSLFSPSPPLPGPFLLFLLLLFLPLPLQSVSLCDFLRFSVFNVKYGCHTHFS